MAERGAILGLALRSLGNRRATALLTLFSIAVSVALLLTVERVRSEARASFASTISGTDLIVGPRSGPLQLLLYSVFRVGSPTGNLSWESYEEIAGSPLVRWTIPISLGDAHRGYRVLGTTNAYFEHYRFGSRRSLELTSGSEFDGTYEAVVGFEVAEALGYTVGTSIIVSHGIGETSFHDHDEDPFTVVGILARTGTPVDQTVHVPLAAIDAIHAPENGGGEHDHGDEHDHGADDHGDEHDHGADDQGDEHDHGADDHGDEHDHGADDHGDEHDHGADDHGDEHDHGADDHGDEHDHGADDHGNGHDDGADDHGHGHTGEPSSITAFLVGLEDRTSLLRLQRAINDYPREPLLAIVPGVTLQELWGLIGTVENVLLAVSGCVIVAGLLGLLAAILTSLNERRREMAILRSVGARPAHVFFLLLSEAAIVAGAGAIVGVAVQFALVAAAREAIETRLGILVELRPPGGFEGLVVIVVMVAAVLLALWPAWRAYRNTLADGLAVRV